VIVRVPDAEPTIGPHRRTHTPSGAEGMPAHVTLLVPFADSTLLDIEMVRELRETLARFSPLQFAIVRLARFAGPPGVLYGAPEPVAPFMRLTERLRDLSGFQPYGGLHTAVIPHLTIATRLADACEVWQHADDGWRMMHSIPLGGSLSGSGVKNWCLTPFFHPTTGWGRRHGRRGRGRPRLAAAPRARSRGPERGGRRP
jgi:hypothetical protein